MINYFVATGNRLSTVINVKIKDWDFSDNLIKLNVVKNRKQQYIPMSSGLKQALKLYLSMWDYTDNDFLFPEYEGGQLSAKENRVAVIRMERLTNIRSKARKRRKNKHNGKKNYNRKEKDIRKSNHNLHN